MKIKMKDNLTNYMKEKNLRNILITPMLCHT